ncbi:hypothetical protein LINPERHAP1_LOCUS11678 [Linum perenne]
MQQQPTNPAHNHRTISPEWTLPGRLLPHQNRQRVQPPCLDCTGGRERGLQNEEL